ncbi:MAG: hypothetical protein NXI02_10820, partial [Rhodobacteraceae bacterium]|nr:hypothetical protein [Paracoccaceae bacterium]
LKTQPGHVSGSPERSQGCMIQLIKVIKRQRRVSFVRDATACPWRSLETLFRSSLVIAPSIASQHNNQHGSHLQYCYLL